jgi:hypothetical protein
VSDGLALEELLSAHPFREFHERFVRASPESVDRAIRRVTADEILFFRSFTLLRNPGRLFGQRESILNPPRGKPLLDVALASGFELLADEPGREIVIGMLVVRPRGVPFPPRADPAAAARRFAELDAPGYAKAAMNFAIEAREGGCRLTTETRVAATDPRTRRRFALYWSVIRPGSGLLRRTWLRAIARRAEAGG